MQTLKRNLAALAKRDPDLAQRIALPVGSDHVRLPDGEQGSTAAYRLGQQWVPLTCKPELAETQLEALPAAPQLLLFGLGLGEQLRAALADDRFSTVVAWERDPWLLRLCLAGHDLAHALRSGQLRLALASDLLDLIPWKGPVLEHPLLGRVYGNERVLLEAGAPQPRALLAAGELFVEDLAAALRRQGFSVLTWEILRHAQEELQLAARRVAPRFAAAINYTHGLSEACSQAGIPLLCWEVDPATDRVAPTGSTEHVAFFTYRRANLEPLRSAGFQRVSYLPLAANPRRREPPELPVDERYRAPISFVGTSMVLQVPSFRQRFLQAFAAWHGAEDPRLAQDALRRVLQAQRLDFSRNLVPELVDAFFPGWRQRAEEQGATDPAILAAEIAAAEKRLNTVAGLGPLGIRAWGDEGWKLTTEAGVTYMGLAGHGAELNRIYAGSLINVDVNRLYQPDIVTMRIFDVLACGGFVLAEHSEALTELLEPGRELDTWSDQDELRRKVQHYLAHPEQARAMAAAGRERVLNEHTIPQRLALMLGALATTAQATQDPTQDPG